MKREWDNGWQGGKFSATRAQRTAMLTSNAKHTGLLGVSEAEGLQPLKGWGMVGGECVITWNRERWELEEHGHFSIATPRWIRGTSVRHQVDFWWARLSNHPDDWELLDIVGHLPAHLFKFMQQRANRVALERLGRTIEHLQREMKPDETDLAMDANRDMRLQKNVDLMRRSLWGTDMHLIVPPGATEGNRKIDVRASTADHVGPGVMFGHHAGFDHVGFKNHHTSEAA